MLRNDLNNLTATIHYERSFVGCGVFYNHSDFLYAITAGHNIYGDSFEGDRDVSKFDVLSDSQCYFQVEEVVGDVNFAKQNDIVLIKLKPKDASRIHSFKSPLLKYGPTSFSDYLVNTNYIGNDGRYTNFLNIKYDTPLSDPSGWFYVDVEDKYLSNNFDEYGPAALDGISGSGIFLDSPDPHIERVLIGIVVEVPSNRMKNKFTCACVSLLQELLPGIKIQPFIRDANGTDISNLLDSLENQFMDQIIESWFQDQANSNSIMNINRKTELIYPNVRLDLERKRIVRNILQGKAVLQKVTENNDFVRKKINTANIAFHGRNDLYSFIINIPDGRAKLEQLSRIYEHYLNSSLENQFDAADISFLANYNIADCISNCTIDFEKIN